jgi:hypothetical protein
VWWPVRPANYRFFLNRTGWVCGCERGNVSYSQQEYYDDVLGISLTLSLARHKP